MSNDDSDWANLSYDNYSDEEYKSDIKKIEPPYQKKEDKSKKIFFSIYF